MIFTYIYHHVVHIYIHNIFAVQQRTDHGWQGLEANEAATQAMVFPVKDKGFLWNYRGLCVNVWILDGFWMKFVCVFASALMVVETSFI